MAINRPGNRRKEETHNVTFNIRIKLKINVDCVNLRQSCECYALTMAAINDSQ